MHLTAGWVIDAIGWLGAASLLAAYGLVSSRRVDGASIPYQLLNLAGGAALVINTVYYGAFPSAFVNVVWIAIAVYSLTAVRMGDRAERRVSRRGAEAQRRGKRERVQS